jgi:hypothetical protein
VSIALLVPLLATQAATGAPPPRRHEGVVALVPNKPLTDAQFCTFAQQVAQQTKRSQAAKNGIRIDSVAADCARRRLVWNETATVPMGAHQFAAMRQNWNRAMCAGWPMLGAVQRGWILLERVKANGRTYDFTATCRGS